MLDPAIHSLSGPDFLDAVADAQAADGNHVNADVYRARGRDWQRHLRRIEALETDLATAQLALVKAQRRSFGAPPAHGHAITPSGSY